MNKDFVRRGIIIPLITAVLSGLIAFAFLSGNIEKISPFQSGAEILYTEGPYSSDKVEEANDLRGGELIGAIGENAELPVRYKGGYSSLLSEGALSEKGAVLGDRGTAYIRIIDANSDVFKNRLTASTPFGGKTYKKADEKTFNSENEIFSVSPRNKSSVVIYYREQGENGLSSKFKAVIYQEVA